MRFSIFLTLFVATFIACTSFTSAENAAVDNTVRRLKGSKLTEVEEERAGPVPGIEKADEIAGRFIKTLNEGKIKRAADAMKANAGKASELTAKQQGKITKMVAQAAKKKVPWSKTKKIIVGLGGAALGGAALYALYKTFVSNGGTPATAATV